MLDFEDLLTDKPIGVKVKIDPKTKKPIKVSKAKNKANKQLASSLKKKLAQQKPIKKPKVKVTIAKKAIAPVTKISVKTPTLFNKKPVIKTEVIKKVAPVSSIKINKTVATKQPMSITVPSARKKQLQGLTKLATIDIKTSKKSDTVSPAKKIADIKKTIQGIKQTPVVMSNESKKKVAKAAVKASSVANKSTEVVAQKAALPEVVKTEEKVSLPAITEVLNDSSTSPADTSLILNKLSKIQDTIVNQKDEAFRKHVFSKLNSIDNKVRNSTLGYQGALGHIKQDALI